MNRDPMIEVKNLTKTFVKNGSTIEVLRGINIEITRGESLAILGTSGAGKTTFLQILGILDQPTSGEVLFDGIKVSELNDGKRAEFRNRMIGFVFQFHHLIPSSPAWKTP